MATQKKGTTPRKKSATRTRSVPKKAPPRDWTETERVILSRRSTRLYQKKQVPAHLVHRVLEAGRFAPSAGNSQPWRFVVVRDSVMMDEMEAEVRELCRRFQSLVDYRRKPATKPLAKTVIWLRDRELHPVPWGAVSFIADGKLRLWHGAPTVILLLKDRRGVSNPDLDCGICGQNMVLAAHSLGLGTCWVGFVKLLQYSRSWMKRLGIEYPYELVNSIALGWPKGEPDGFVEREVHAVDWYEGGEKKNEDRLDWKDRFVVPDFDENDPGRVEVNEEDCTGCSFCVRACPASALELGPGGRARMVPGTSECIACGDCVAICPEGAIRLLEPLRLKGRFRPLHRGRLAGPTLAGPDDS